MKHTLSSFRRSSALRILCIFVLAIMCAPAAMAAAASAPVGMPIATSSHAGSAFLAAALGGMMLLRTPADDGGKDNGGGGQKAEDPVDPAAAIKAIEDKTLPMSQRLTVALNALKGQAPAEQFAKVSADLATAQATLKIRDGELADANARIKALEADVAANEKTITELGQENKDLKAKEQDIETRAKAKSKEEMKALGFPSSKLPNPDPKLNAAGTYEEAIAEYAKIDDPKAAAAYWNANVLPRLGKPGN